MCLVLCRRHHSAPTDGIVFIYSRLSVDRMEEKGYGEMASEDITVVWLVVQIILLGEEIEKSQHVLGKVSL